MNANTNTFNRSFFFKRPQLGVEHFSQLKNILNTVSDAIVISDARTGRVVFVNDKLLEAFGYQSSELIDQPLSKLFADTCYKKLMSTLKYRLGSSFTEQACINRKSGTKIEATLHCSKYNQGNNKYYQIIVKATSSHKSYLNKIKASRKRFKLMFDAAPNAYFICNADGVVIKCNDAATRLSGFSKSEIKNSFIGDITMVSRERRASFLHFLKHKSQENSCFEFEIETKNGEQKYVKMFSHRREIDGEQLVLNIVTDLTHKKRIYRQLKQKKQDLEVFLYRVGHDLNGPFTTMEGLVNVMQHESLNDSAKEYLHLMKSALVEGKVLVDNLVNTSLSSQEQSVAKVVDVNKAINTTIESLKYIDGFTNINFKIDTPDFFAFKTQPSLLQCVLQNLLQSAIKYQKPKNESLKPVVKIKGTREDGGITLSIIDNGIGFKNEDLSRVFDHHYRSNSIVDGLGLGLYIAKNAVDEMQGTISVASVPNEETRFDIEFPNVK